MRFLVFLGWAWVVGCVLSTLACAIGSIWADGSKALATNLSDTGWLGAILSVISGVVMGVWTAYLSDEGKL